MATAAIRSKQLGDMLSGDSPHTREVQCEESEMFLGYFGVFLPSFPPPPLFFSPSHFLSLSSCSRPSLASISFS